MSKPIYALITDTHLDISNYDVVVDVIKKQIDKVHDMGLRHLYHGGDVFNSRKSQYLIVLLAWQDCLDYGYEKGVHITAIPGNHDKSDYLSEDSYLDVFKNHPNFTPIRDYSKDTQGDWTLHLIPFFEEKSMYASYLNRVDYQSNDLLLTHVAVDGVRNNDGSQVEETLSHAAFEDFYKVFVGHYHDKQQVKDNIHYIGALVQKNFGEDDLKGMTVVYDDGSHELIQSDFSKYQTIKVDLDTISLEDLDVLRMKYQDSDDSIRFKITGSKEKVASLDKSKFDAVGIDIKCQYKSAEVDVSFDEASTFSGFDSQKIKDEWEEFCQDNSNIDQDEGLQLLNKIL